jgi:uncharacterized protein (UPF0335 family)
MSDIVAADQLKAIVQRVERIESDIADRNADKSEIYKEARAIGFDVKIIKKVVSKRKLDQHEREEQDNVFDLYWNAVHGMNLVHAHARENIEEFPASNGSPSVPPLANNARDEESVAGEAVGIASVSPTISPETASEFHAKASSDNGATEQDIEGTADSVTGDASRPSRRGDTPAFYSPGTAAGETGMVLWTGKERPMSIGLHTDGDQEARFETDSLHQDKQMDRATEGSFETGSEAAEKGREAIPAGPEGVDLNHAGAGESPATDQPLIGGDHEVTGIAERDRDIPTSNTGEGADSALPALEYTPKMGVKRWHLAHFFPSLSKAEADLLEKDIAANGVHTPIIRQGDVILDGWERYNHSRKYGRAYPVIEYSGNDALLDVIELQRAARNFTPAQERKIAADLAKAVPDRAEAIMAAFGLAEVLEAAQ